MIPLRITFQALGNCDDSALARNLAAAEGLPRIGRAVHVHPVAVAGGGPLLDVEALRQWPGDIWAINHTADFLLDRGIDCTLMTVDPAPMKFTAAKRLLASCCDPSVFEGEFEVFDLSEHAPGGVVGGSTSATRAPMLAALMGYPGVVFFGCESSFTDVDHIDRNEEPERQLIIRADGADWRTSPQMMVQAQELTWLVKHCKGVEERSGGLLRAMLKDDGWEVVAVNDAMKKHLDEINGPGLWEGQYKEPQCLTG